MRGGCVVGPSALRCQIVITSLRRLAIKTSSSLQRSVGSAIVAYRRVCQKGAGSEGAIPLLGAK